MILYTKNMCAKCEFVKNKISDEGNLDKLTIINLDEKPESIEFLKSKGFSAMPILQVEDDFYLTPFEIIEIVNS